MARRCRFPGRSMAKRERFRWQEAHVAYFCEIVPGHSQDEVSDMFEDRFGVRLSVSQVKNAKMRYHVRSGTNGGQFKPGQKAWNKGVPASEWMSPEAMERCKASRFQHGNVPLNAKAFKVGDERINADGYTEVKIAELTSKEVKKVWKPKHLIVWESEHGCKVPDGHAVIFADQDRSNFDPANLVAIKRSDLVQINRMGLAYHDPESLRVCLAIIELNRVTRSRQLTPRACRQCGVEFTPAFKDQRRCRNCIDLEPSFKRSQASSGGSTNGKEQPNG